MQPHEYVEDVDVGDVPLRDDRHNVYEMQADQCEVENDCDDAERGGSPGA
jgi:hypothetical protein